MNSNISSKNYYFENQRYFKDQISFRINISETKKKTSKISGNANVQSFVNGFFNNDVYEHHREIVEYLFEKSSKNVVLELPPYTGKTSAAFFSSFLKSFNEGKNSILIYPSETKRDIAYRFINKKLRKLYYHEFPIVEILEHNSQLLSSENFLPKIYFTDIFTLHANIIPNFNHPIFWQQIGLIVIEDVENYKNIFGTNSAYVFRRLRAKLQRYKSIYQVLITNTPIKNRTQFIGELTGIRSQEIEEIVNINGAYAPKFQLSHWYSPVETINILENNLLVFKRNKYFDELENIVHNLITQEKQIAIFWQKCPVSKDDIANIKTRFLEGNSEAYLFIGNTIDEIRFQLITSDLDWNDIDIILIIGCIKPISQYLGDLRYCGNENHTIIVYENQSPSLQYYAVDAIKKNEITVGTNFSHRGFSLNLEDSRIINSHLVFLSEEYPEIKTEDVKAIFPKEFAENFGNQNRSFTGKFLYLNKDIKFIPKGKRCNEQLTTLPSESLFSLMSTENGKRIQIGKFRENLIRAYCYPSAKLNYKMKGYLVNEVDYNKREVYLSELLNTYLKTYKLTNYEIEIIQENNINSFYEFGNNLKVSKGLCRTTETILGIKKTNDYEEFDESQNNENSFKDIDLPVVELNFDPSVLILDDKSNEESVRQILHTIAHLLIEAIRTDTYVNTDEIAIKIDVKFDGNELSAKIYFIDITGLNIDFRDKFQSGDIRKLFEIAEMILLQCPCDKGSKICIRIDYCNIPSCNKGTNLLDKLSTLKVIGKLLERRPNVIEIRSKWKKPENEIDVDATGVTRSDTDKMAEIDKFACSIIQHKGLISFKPLYNLRFATDAEIQEGKIKSNDLGYTDHKNREILCHPGLWESLLYRTIFSERFHNYQYCSNNGKRNLSNSLEYFNWDNIDDNKNIPYIGHLFYEGSAIWFSMRMMEFFSDISFINEFQLYQTRIGIAGLKTMIEIEKNIGYYKTLQSLKRGFVKQDYENICNSTVQSQLNDYFKNSTSQTNNQEKQLDELVCLRKSDKLGNLNRVSYFLASLDLGTESLMQNGIKEIYNMKEFRHISRTDIEKNANMETLTYINNGTIRKRLSSIIGINKHNNLCCQECNTRCNLFNACMINGGLRNFKDILLLLFPKHAKK